MSGRLIEWEGKEAFSLFIICRGRKLRSPLYSMGRDKDLRGLLPHVYGVAEIWNDIYDLRPHQVFNFLF